MALRRAKSFEERDNIYLKVGRGFARRVAARLRPGVDAVIGFSYASLEVFEKATAQGICCILDQIDPAFYEWEIVKEERSKFSDWETNQAESEPSCECKSRIRKEWELADTIIVNSEFSRRALIGAGVLGEKIEVSAPAIEFDERLSKMSPQKSQGGRLRVLFLGILCLRKGVHYFLEAARMLHRAGRNVQFTLAGSSMIRPEKLREYADVAAHIGRVPRRDVPNLLVETDVLVLPSISEGFAFVQIEAMAQGVPVIATTNTGDAVRDGVDGFRIPIRSAEAIADRIARLDDDRELLREFSRNALERARDFSLENYCKTFPELIRRCIVRFRSSPA